MDMGLFEKVFGRKSKQLTANAGRGSIFQTLTAYAPVFTTWGGQLYEDELIRATVCEELSHWKRL